MACGPGSALSLIVDKSVLKAWSVRQSYRFGVALRSSASGDKLVEAARQLSVGRGIAGNVREPAHVSYQHGSARIGLLLGGDLAALGQGVKLMLAQYVKPYVKRGKNDRA